jgi:hypothetical protein
MEPIGDDTLCVLLTGGRSRRMGRDKASIPRASGVPQARHLGTLVTELAGVRGVELGPGVSGLAAHGDRGEGPAVALADAVARGYLAARVLVVVPVDLFRLERGGLGWLVRQARQAPLVVRIPAGVSWAICGGRVEAFRWGGPPRSMRALVRGFRLVAPPPGIVDQFLDADRPEDLI